MCRRVGRASGLLQEELCWCFKCERLVRDRTELESFFLLWINIYTVVELIGRIKLERERISTEKKTNLHARKQRRYGTIEHASKTLR